MENYLMHPADHVQNKIFMKTIFHFRVDQWRGKISYAFSIQTVEISLLVRRPDLLIDALINFGDLSKAIDAEEATFIDQLNVVDAGEP